MGIYIFKSRPIFLMLSKLTGTGIVQIWQKYQSSGHTNLKEQGSECIAKVTFFSRWGKPY